MNRNPRYEGESPDRLTWHLDPNTDPALKKGVGGCLIIPTLGTTALIGFGATSSFEASAPQPEVIKEGSYSNELFEDNIVTIEI